MQQGTLEPASDGADERVEVIKMMINAVEQLTEKVKERVAPVTEATLLDINKIFDSDHSKSFIRGAFRRATRYMMTTMLADDGVVETVKFTIT